MEGAKCAGGLSEPLLYKQKRNRASVLQLFTTEFLQQPCELDQMTQALDNNVTQLTASFQHRGTTMNMTDKSVCPSGVKLDNTHGKWCECVCICKSRSTLTTVNLLCPCHMCVFIHSFIHSEWQVL